MALNFNRVRDQQPAAQDEGIEETYDIQADRQRVELQLANSPELEALTSQIEVDNLETIVSFGAGTAEEIAEASDAAAQ